MKKEDKIKFVEEWSTEIKDFPYAVLVDYRGLTVAEETRLRHKMKEAETCYRVVKNNLAKLAVPGTGLEELADHFRGPCAVAYCKAEPVTMAKALVDFAKDSPALEIKAGVVDGRFLDAKEVKQLSKLPGRSELLAKLQYVLVHPISGLATALNNIVRNLATVLHQVAETKK